MGPARWRNWKRYAAMMATIQVHNKTDTILVLLFMLAALKIAKRHKSITKGQRRPALSPLDNDPRMSYPGAAEHTFSASIKTVCQRQFYDAILQSCSGRFRPRIRGRGGPLRRLPSSPGRCPCGNIGGDHVPGVGPPGRRVAPRHRQAACRYPGADLPVGGGVDRVGAGYMVGNPWRLQTHRQSLVRRGPILGGTKDRC